MNHERDQDAQVLILYSLNRAVMMLSYQVRKVELPFLREESHCVHSIYIM